jgi:uncharacterized protein YeaO (DUF488 family)
MKLYTAQYRYSGESRTDITVKSGWKPFAPTWDMVMGYKAGTLSQEQYTEQYIKLMDKSREDFYRHWCSLLMRKEVTLVCFCKKGDFCHRVLLAEYLQKWFPRQVKYYGER